MPRSVRYRSPFPEAGSTGEAERWQPSQELERVTRCITYGMKTGRAGFTVDSIRFAVAAKLRNCTRPPASLARLRLAPPRPPAKSAGISIH